MNFRLKKPAFSDHKDTTVFRSTQDPTQRLQDTVDGRHRIGDELPLFPELVFEVLVCHPPHFREWCQRQTEDQRTGKKFTPVIKPFTPFSSTDTKENARFPT